MKKKSFGVIALVIILYFLGNILRLRNETDVASEGVICTAIVIDIYSVKSSRYFEYQYEVNGIIYHNHRNKAREQYRHLEIGDSILIEYKQSDPQKSYPLDFRTIGKNGKTAIIEKQP